ncbi:hypothetical protein KS4_34780 [Poriferisphaera corsica]|uniref:DNA mimic protein DMP19 C-terminal domain-containing protein n=2 Tax=Poriferisphaera corsica TaxID=2528020 RepID=A0A517YYW0_9BACT|nr:hypothetical protein KS4_34780 [Poriferisphaera corsica]
MGVLQKKSGMRRTARFVFGGAAISFVLCGGQVRADEVESGDVEGKAARYALNEKLESLGYPVVRWELDLKNPFLKPWKIDDEKKTGGMRDVYAGMRLDGWQAMYESVLLRPKRLEYFEAPKVVIGAPEFVIGEKYPEEMFERIAAAVKFNEPMFADLGVLMGLEDEAVYQLGHRTMSEFDEAGNPMIGGLARTLYAVSARTLMHTMAGEKSAAAESLVEHFRLINSFRSANGLIASLVMVSRGAGALNDLRYAMSVLSFDEQELEAIERAVMGLPTGETLAWHLKTELALDNERFQLYPLSRLDRQYELMSKAYRWACINGIDQIEDAFETRRYWGDDLRGSAGNGKAGFTFNGFLDGYEKAFGPYYLVESVIDFDRAENLQPREDDVRLAGFYGDAVEVIRLIEKGVEDRGVYREAFEAARAINKNQVMKDEHPFRWLERIMQSMLQGWSDQVVAITAIRAERFYLKYGRYPKDVLELGEFGGAGGMPVCPFTGAAVKMRELPVGLLVYTDGKDGQTQYGLSSYGYSPLENLEPYGFEDPMHEAIERMYEASEESEFGMKSWLSTCDDHGFLLVKPELRGKLEREEARKLRTEDVDEKVMDVLQSVLDSDWIWYVEDEPQGEAEQTVECVYQFLGYLRVIDFVGYFDDTSEGSREMGAAALERIGAVEHAKVLREAMAKFEAEPKLGFGTGILSQLRDEDIKMLAEFHEKVDGLEESVALKLYAYLRANEGEMRLPKEIGEGLE